MLEEAPAKLAESFRLFLQGLGYGELLYTRLLDYVTHEKPLYVESLHWNNNITSYSCSYLKVFLSERCAYCYHSML